MVTSDILAGDLAPPWEVLLQVKSLGHPRASAISEASRMDQNKANAQSLRGPDAISDSGPHMALCLWHKFPNKDNQILICSHRIHLQLIILIKRVSSIVTLNSQQRPRQLAVGTPGLCIETSIRQCSQEYSGLNLTFLWPWASYALWTSVHGSGK